MDYLGIRYVYGLFCPDTNVLRYVGMTKALSRRLSCHMTSRSKYLSPKEKWMDELKAKDKIPLMLVFASGDYSEAKEIEKNIIMSIGIDKLLNQTIKV